MKISTLKHLVRDLVVLAVSIWLAWWLAHSSVLERLAEIPPSYAWWASLVAGMLFTSLLTTAPAIVVLGSLALRLDLVSVAMIGAVGALAGDLLLFFLFKNHVAKDVAWLTKNTSWGRFWRVARHSRFRWLAALTGGVVIASPLPDELGIAIMGIGHTPTGWFVPISLGLNFVGILIIGLVARGLF
ncbi:MAG: hypothetical protein A3I32_02955 [Candidatus Yanofskybacteria bacterium RIFCSPLOWO2_02_FULL_45_10]|uniref:Uncharacterized protein n=1 Tax=Candidatus Yanofskybacteria bacterium RIFCSPLOWO2_02_FULL_45_10 TaxID=1802706 RepID=A0A1F8H244_9BACT|nr:MAG: hypothetical protein A3I32_02955 [Candidatus Yanofskybacteria bacterium RIFCSPLOWO2_02_FULL_45_10]